MSENSAKTFDLSTWAKGDRGIHHPSATERPAIHNLVMYDTGILGPRPLWHEWEELAAAFSGGGFNGGGVLHPGVLVTNLGPRLSGGSNIGEGFIIAWQNDFEIYSWDSSSIYAERSSGVTDAPYPFGYFSRLDDYRMLVMDGFIDIEKHGTGSGPITVAVQVADIATDFGYGGWKCIASAIHGGRAFYIGYDDTGTDAIANRLHWSDLDVGDTDAYTTFTVADQYVDLDGQLAGMVSLGPNLLVWDDDGQWYLIQGRGNPTNATLNRLGSNIVPHQNQPSVIGNTAFFIDRRHGRVCSVNSAGVIDYVTLGHHELKPGRSLRTNLQTLSFTGHHAGIVAMQDHSLLRAYYNGSPTDTNSRGEFKGKYMANGVWVTDDFYQAEYGTEDVNQYGTDLNMWFSPGESYEAMMFTTYNITNGTESFVNYRSVNISHPDVATDDDVYERAEGYGSLKLPRISESNKQVRLKRVIVDGVVWGSDTGVTPAFSARFSTDNQTNDALTSGPSTYTAKAATLADNEDSEEFRATYTPTENSATYDAFIDVELYNMVHIGIKRVTVEYEISQGNIF